eukprot:29584-Pelagococcus_subviridis.AAC.3
MNSTPTSLRMERPDVRPRRRRRGRPRVGLLHRGARLPGRGPQDHRRAVGPLQRRKARVQRPEEALGRREAAVAEVFQANRLGPGRERQLPQVAGGGAFSEITFFIYAGLLEDLT